MSDYAPYAWLIIHDSIADDDAPRGTNDNAKGVTGPRNADPDMISLLCRAAKVGKDKWHGAAVEWFRMCDGDGELCYSGVRTGEADEKGSEDGFEPLDDFGTPNAGCTEIRYYNHQTKEWDTL